MSLPAASAGGAPIQDPAEHAPSASELMEHVAESFRALEQALERRDAAPVANAAVDLLDSWAKSAVVQPQRHPGARAAFDGYFRSAGDTTREIASLAASDDFVSAGQALDELRATCISCHVKFREQEAQSVFFPARRGAVTGVVKLRTVSGASRDDRSNVVVFLEGGPAQSAAAVSRRRPVMSQRDRRFEPHVLPVLRGTIVDFPNDDTVYHNVFSLSTAKPFDLGVYEQGCCRSVDFQESGLVRVYCNIHPHMIATIVVLQNPYFAVTDSAGLFVIPEVPDGEYALRTWYEYGGDTREHVTVSGTSILVRSLQLQEDRTQLEHKSKYGQPSREKYQ
jgi:plastocyanin